MISQRLFNTTQHLAKELAWQLEHHDRKIVLAEGCTAGLVSALLAQVPGISKWLCGSAVTYQEEVQQQWLRIEPELLVEYSTVSAQVTQSMAASVLKRTPCADLSISVTGHLERNSTLSGPIAFIAAAHRINLRVVANKPTSHPLNGCSRMERQWQAARDALDVALENVVYRLSDPTRVDWYRMYTRPTNFHWDHFL